MKTTTSLWLISMLLCVAGQLSAQELTVTGKVTDGGDGRGIPGVTVLIKGTAQGTITDNDGAYQLTRVSAGAFLIFSFVGLQTQEVEVGQRTSVDVSMIQDARQLSEIVVTGSGVPTEKRKLAFALESISGDNLPKAPTASIDQALVGRIPGALIMSGNGSPGSEISILLRGINSVNRGSQPMILVNGIEMGTSSLNSLDLNTVDHIEVVQGAAAASIYGAQGANGVIQVFTKKGKAGRLQVDFSTNIAVNEWLNVGGLSKANMHSFKTNDDNYVVGGSGDTLVLDPGNLRYNTNVVWDFTDTSAQTNKPYNRNLVYHDHFKEFYTQAITTNHSLSISGASGNIDFSFSASNNHQESNFKGDGYNDRTNLISNFGVELIPKLTLRSVTQLVYTKNTVNIWNKQGFSTNGLIFGIMNSRPFTDYFMTDTVGNHGISYGAAGPNQFNPNYTFQYAKTMDKKADLLQSFELNYEPWRILNINLKYGINLQNRTVTYDVANQSLNANSNFVGSWEGWNAQENTGELSSFQTERASQNFLGAATLNLDFKDDLGWNLPIKSTTGAAFDYRSYNTHEYNTYGLGMPLEPPFTANQATTFKIARDFTTEFVTFGYRVNQKFEWGEVAGISGGFRTDYSSAFGSGSKPFTFPRGDAYFRVSGLDFWNGSAVSSVLLDWKVRAAYGQAGIQPQPFDRFPTLSTRTLGGTNAYYLGPDQSNPNLNVEVSTEVEVGTDLAFEGLKGIWIRNSTLSFTYWKRTTENAISPIDAPPSSGVGRVIDNAFSVGSNGIQASLTTEVLKSKSLSWSMTINFGRQTSITESVKNNVQIAQGDYVLKAGEKVGQLYGYLLLHDVNAVDPLTGGRFIPVDSSGYYQVAGNGWVVDKRTKLPYVTPGRYALGDPFPSFNASFINDFTFKRFLSFGFQFDWIQGGDIYNATKGWMYRDGIHSDYTKEFEINGVTGSWVAFYHGVYSGVQSNGVKNYFYEDGSFVRLRNVYFGIDFSRILKIGVRKLQLVLTGRNLLTWTKYTGMDPELSAFNPSQVNYQRWDHNVLPNFRTYQITLNIGL